MKLKMSKFQGEERTWNSDTKLYRMLEQEKNSDKCLSYFTKRQV